MKTDLLMKWERLLAGGLFVALIASMTTAAKLNVSLQRRTAGELRQLEEQLSAPLPETPDLTMETAWQQLELQKERKADYERGVPRDIFSPYRQTPSSLPPPAPENPVKQTRLELVDIRYKPLDINYEGRLVYSDARLIAQMNVGGRTFLVQSGDELDGYVVTHVGTDAVELRKKNSTDSVRINYRRIAYTNELIAIIRQLPANSEHIVEKSMTAFGFKIVDIREDALVVKNNIEERVIEKGMVWQ